MYSSWAAANSSVLWATALTSTSGYISLAVGVGGWVGGERSVCLEGGGQGAERLRRGRDRWQRRAGGGGG
jgi:hypothetical protein